MKALPLTALNDALPSVVLLDLVMPVMDGTAFLHRLRKHPRRADIPVVICTAKDLNLDERRRLLTQAAEIVEKGEGLEDSLTKALSSHLARPPAPSRRLVSKGGGQEIRG